MKKTAILTVLLFTAVIAFSAGQKELTSEPVPKLQEKEQGTPQQQLFPDPALDKIIRNQLDKDSFAPIADSELDNITELWATGCGITDLSGLERCTKLRIAALDSNNIKVLSPLRQLTSIEHLSIGNNPVSEAEFAKLSSLKALTHLNIENLGYSDESLLANFPNIEVLLAGENAYESIESLSGAVALRVLNLRGNNLENLESLKELRRKDIINRGDTVNILDNPRLSRPPMQDWNDLMDDFLYLVAEGIDCLLFPEQTEKMLILYIIDAGTKQPLFDLSLELTTDEGTVLNPGWSYPGIFFVDVIEEEVKQIRISLGDSLKEVYKQSRIELSPAQTDDSYDNDNVLLIEVFRPEFCTDFPNFWFGTGKPSDDYNLALNRPWRSFPLSSSLQKPYFSNPLNDGSPFSSQGFHQSSPTGWVEIDLEQLVNPSDLKIVLGGTPWGWQETAFKIETSADGKNWDDAGAVENPNDRMNIVKYNGKAFRYIRAELLKESYFGDSSFYEIGVYNNYDPDRDFWILDPYPNTRNIPQSDYTKKEQYFRPVLNGLSEFYNSNAARLNDNLAIGASLWATERSHNGENLAFAFDGNPDTELWNHFIPSNDKPFVVIADFDNEYPVDYIEFELIHNHVLTIEGSPDLKNWTELTTARIPGFYQRTIPRKRLRYIRLTFTPADNLSPDQQNVRFDLDFIGLKTGGGFDLSESGRLSFEKLALLSAFTFVPETLTENCGYTQYIIRKEGDNDFYLDFTGTSLTRFPALSDGIYIIEARPVWEPAPPKTIGFTPPSPVRVKITDGKAEGGDRLEFRLELQ